MADTTLPFPIDLFDRTSYSGKTEEKPETVYSEGTSVGVSDFYYVIPSPETIEAITQTETGENVDFFANEEELFNDLGL